MVDRPMPLWMLAAAAMAVVSACGAGAPEVAHPDSAAEHPDRDGDGLADDRDLCPDDPEDRDEFEDEDGCPDPDNDADRILDYEDDCPSESETYNGIEDDDGCPDSGEVVLPQQGLLIVEYVHFAPGSTEVPARAAPLLDAVAATMEGNPQIELAACLGRAGPRERRPERLSLARAEAVCSMLVDRGISPTRLTSYGVGARDPLRTGADADPDFERSVSMEILVDRGTEYRRWNGRTLEDATPTRRGRRRR